MQDVLRTVKYFIVISKKKKKMHFHEIYLRIISFQRPIIVLQINVFMIIKKMLLFKIGDGFNWDILNEGCNIFNGALVIRN